MVTSTLVVKNATKMTREKGLEPAQLAKTIRQLALDTHHALSSDVAREEELVALSLRIEDLRRETEHSAYVELDRWLQSAQEQIERACHGCYVGHWNTP